MPTTIPNSPNSAATPTCCNACWTVRRAPGRLDPTRYRICLLPDALADLDRMQQQLVQGGAIELGWMGTDPNRRTRRLYQRLRDRVQRLSSVPADERVTIINELVAEAEQEKQLQEGQVQQIVAGSPWLAELDRWRIPADEVEKALQTASANELRRLPRLFAQFVDTLIETPGQFNTLPECIGNYQADIDRLIAEGPQLSSAELMRRFRLEVSPTIPQELVELAENVLLLSLVQARNRAVLSRWSTFDLHPEAALEIARAHRGDWMNARAALVDAWRQIRFNQDNLQSTLDVVFRGDLANRDDNPFSFDSATGRLAVGHQFDAPITRPAERNTYREALIEYQQRRREYYAFEDYVARRLRDILRTLQLNHATSRSAARPSASPTCKSN